MTEVPQAQRVTAHAAAETAARNSYGKLVAFLAADTRDLASAEDALAEAFSEAIETWPTSGVPGHPEAWLLTVARRKRLDVYRKAKRDQSAAPRLALAAEELTALAHEPSAIPDRRLALMFVCAHPAIEPAIRTPLILQAVLGLDAASIGDAFLIAPSAMSQRLVRAKAKIRDAGIAFRMPDAPDLKPRLDSVLEAVYGAFSRGWDHLGDATALHRDLTQEALFLGRLLTQLLPDSPEALGLMSLMLFAQARRPARRGKDGSYIPLSEQDTGLWDRAMIDAAEALLWSASSQSQIGRFQLEAAIQSAHAARRYTGRTDWPAIMTLYEALAIVTDSPVVAVNKAIAVGRVLGPRAGLSVLEGLQTWPGLMDYQPYWAATASLLLEAGDHNGASAAYDAAISLSASPAEKCFLEAKRREIGH